MLQKPAYLRVVAAQHKIIPTKVIIKLAVIALVLVIVWCSPEGFTAEWGNFQPVCVVVVFLEYSASVVTNLQIIKVHRLGTLIADVHKTVTPPERSVGQAFLGALIFERTKAAAPLPGVTTLTCWLLSDTKLNLSSKNSTERCALGMADAP